MTAQVLINRVTKHTPSLLVGVLMFLFVTSLVALGSNIEVISSILFNSQVAASTKVTFFFSLYGSLFSNQTLFSGAVVLITAFLSGLNAALVTYYIAIVKTGRVSKRATMTSISGLVAGFFGIGCAACGSILLTALLSGFGSAVLLLLPFKGAEIGILGILLLVYAVRTLITEIEKGKVCT